LNTIPVPQGNGNNKPYVASALVQKLTGVRDLKKILETTVKDLGEQFRAETCQVMLTNPLDPNVTSICEFRASKDEPPDTLPAITMPLVLHGRTLGSVSLARYGDMSADEVNTMRVILGELGDIIRGAQINDVVQRDTFRDTFLVEIGNVMAYSLGIGDALFMVVNILGKVLHASRCLFICTDDTQAGWKCYEFWQQDKVQSCQDYRWPTSDSAVIARTLLTNAPLSVYEGQVNSYISPVQEELQFINVKSLLGVPLRSADATHGCVILQQCDYRRAWTRGEIDMVQNVADKVAEALVKLPAEKRAREPIMQLHQRIVQQPGEEGKALDAVSVRNALKGTFGQQAIPSARKTSSHVAPSAPKPAAQPKPAALPPPTAPVKPAADAGAVKPDADAAKWPQKLSDVETLIKMPTVPGGTESLFAQPGKVAEPAAWSGPTAPAQPATAPTRSGESFAPPKWPEAPAISPVQAKSAEPKVGTPLPPISDTEAPGSGAGSGKGFGNILGNRSSQTELPAAADAAGAKSGGSGLYANLDFGPAETAETADTSPEALGRGAADDTWGTLDALPTSKSAAPEMKAGTVSGAETGHADAAEPAPAGDDGGKWGNLDSIKTPSAPPTTTAAWGDLDSIGAAEGSTSTATPSGHRTGGLTSMMAGKARANVSSKPFSKARAALAAESPAAVAAAAAPAAVAEAEPLDDAAVEAKLKAALAKSSSEATSSSDETGDYIYSIVGLDPRTAGRVSSWIQEIEAKDRYVAGHARQVAELSVAIAKEAGLSQAQVDMVQLAGLLHDVGKRACAPEVLQKKDEELTDPELIVMMKHPIDGAELLESFADLKHIAEIVRAHHEEYDGNGYPQGLKGNDIPIEARVVCLANSYHSLISNMSYGPGLSPQKAQEELVKGANKQWDPALVQALLQAIMGKKVSVLS
jgi:putative nucleotidyltransferase with HDIG domain